jgi:ribosomal protein L6P/L9E
MIKQNVEYEDTRLKVRGRYAESKRSLSWEVVKTTHENSEYVVARRYTKNQDKLFKSRLLGNKLQNIEYIRR